MRRSPTSAAWRLARRAWRLLYSDSQACIAAADEACERAQRQGDVGAEGWARLARGFHLIWYATPQDARAELNAAQACFDTAGERALVVKCVLGDRPRRTDRIKSAVSGDSSPDPMMSSCSFSGFRAKAFSSWPICSA